MKFFIEKVEFPSHVYTLFGDSTGVESVKVPSDEVVVHYSISIKNSKDIKTGTDGVTGKFILTKEQYNNNCKPEDLIELIKKLFRKINSNQEETL